MKILIPSLALLILFTNQVIAQSEEDPEPFWPKEIVTENYTINIYQPQNETYSAKDNELVSRAAFSIKKNDADNLTFGSMWTNASLNVDRETRMANLASIEVTDVRFPEDVDESKVELFSAFLEGEIPKWDIEFPQDELIASLEKVEGTYSDELNHSPPTIIFSNEPAVLLFYDGEPKLAEIDKKYDRVVNTAMFVAKLKKSEEYYLSGGDLWYTSNNPLGPWKYEKNVPNKLEKLKEEYTDERNEENTADDDLDVPVEKDAIKPKIITVTEPSELIVIEGESEFVPIQNTNLLYVDNTESDLFMDVETQEYFILISGRWFRSTSTSGPWNYIASDQLPEDFQKIPEGSDKDAVLASVAGTDAAQDAKHDAYIPQTAAVDRNTATASVEYDGDPKFEQIEGVSLQYAVNTSSTVLKSGNKFYLCDNAIWFVSSSATGPWSVADERPEEVEEIPPSNPTYNVKYVYIYETTPTVVHVGYLPGYYGCYAYGPTIVYGTGFWYRGWYGRYYYPRPVTYGFSVRYNPYYGWSMGFSVHFGSPYRWYGCGRGFYGPPFYRPPVHYHRPPGGYYGHRPGHYVNHHRYNNNYNRNAYNNRKGTRPATRPAQPGNRPTTRPSQPGNRPTTRPSQPSTKPTTRPAQPSTKPTTRPAQPSTKPTTKPAQPSTKPTTRPAQPSTNNRAKNNVYSDKQGNIQRKTDKGWQQRNNNSWSQPQQNNRSNQQMNRSYQNRQRGAQRTQNFNQQRSRSAPSRSRGGGRRR